MRELVRSFFAPWHRQQERRGRRFSLEDAVGNLVINVLSRVLGAGCRVCILVAATVLALAVTVLLCAIIVWWLLAPALILLMVWHGVTLLFFVPSV